MSMETSKTSLTGKIPPWLVCVDVETTGLDPERCGLLSIGGYHPASSGEFYVECAPRPGCVVDEEAIRVNGQDIEEARKREISDGEAVVRLRDWLGALRTRFYGANRLVLVGKNPKFDVSFLESTAVAGPMCHMSRRLIDVHSVALALAAARGMDAPALKIDTVYTLLGLPVEPSPHNAFRGALFAWKALAAMGEITGAISGEREGGK